MGARRNTAARRLELVVVEDERARISSAIRIREDVFVDAATIGEEIVEREIRHAGEEPTLLEEWEDLALVALDEPLIGLLVPLRAAVFHAVFFVESFDLPVTEHR